MSGVTATLKLQDAPGARVAPLMLILPAPGGAVIDPPLQLPVSPLGVEITNPVARVLENETPVNATTWFGFITLNVKGRLAPFGIAAAENVSMIVGGCATMIVAEAVVPVPPSVDAIAPVTLLIVPSVVPTTLTVRVHVPLAPTIPPLSAMLVETATAVAVPPQLFTIPAGFATCSPTGSASVKLSPLKDDGFKLAIVNVSAEVPLGAISDGANSPVMFGRAKHGQAGRRLSLPTRLRSRQRMT